MPLFPALGVSPDEPPAKGAIALVDTPKPPFGAEGAEGTEPLSPPRSPRTSSDRRSTDTLDAASILPMAMATTYHNRTTRPKQIEYGPVPSEDERLLEDDASENGSFDDEATVVPEDVRRWRRRRRRPQWLACGVVWGLCILVVLLILGALFVFSHVVYDDGDDGDDPDAIFAGWGLDGNGIASTSEGPGYPVDFMRDVVPIPCHSHNDYWHNVPLFSALHAGCIGTEADVWLVDGDLLVGHKWSDLAPERTFRSLYVDPLMQILERANADPDAVANGTSSPAATAAARGVFATQPDQTLALLVDVKTDGAATFRKVLEQVEPLRQRGWLSEVRDGQVTYGPVTVVGTGDTPFDVVVENSTHRHAFFDAPLDGLDGSPYDRTNSYYASVALRRGLGMVWFGVLRAGQLQTMRHQLLQAHARGLQARYWNLPSWPVSVRDTVWGTLVREGVDLLNVDDLRAAMRLRWGGPKDEMRAVESVSNIAAHSRAVAQGSGE